ncbi:poly-gamma-glutamate synthesis protein (capsule biosynthesis protein) [Leucobacter exalbidus]|uniref:Poly-gamma-glutamate synthesis protein (Capsule biosynthesis protein) n=1 Tax=Leucobacter exalbidus TaxID=662960 RepID=A0A940PQ89_9MICO|nr:CapA family protein [Leucobacter exalbidus]MBP1327160.1 poly-gamma-glutamate synthesis protein (capsule biosynthesis protein) [Leucobacter exalbidus]
MNGIKKYALAMSAALLVLASVGCAPEPGTEADTKTSTSATDASAEESGAGESDAAATPEAPAAEPVSLPGAGPECPTDHCVSVAVSGDLLFHEGLWSQYAIETNEAGQNFDFVPLLEGQKAYLDQTDLAVCQMETPLAPVGGPYLGYPAFSTPPELAAAVKAVGYDVCTTASNHTVDQGTEGLLRTLDGLDAAGIAHTGSYRAEGDRDEPLIVEANGAKVAILTSTFSLNGLNAEHDWQVDFRMEEPRVDPERMIIKAQKARDMGADLVIGVQHIGEEYWSEPTPGQMELAHQLHDSGLFDFVYQHHAHAVQPLEDYNGKWVLYGTGNTISESAPAAQQVNNEFLMTRVQFAKQADGTWTTNDVAWNAATNTQDGAYKWCSVMPDQPQGVCQSPEFDSGVLSRTAATVNAMGAAESGAHEWLVTQE